MFSWYQRENSWVFVWDTVEHKKGRVYTGIQAKEGYESDPLRSWVFLGHGSLEETIYIYRKESPHVRPEGLSCFPINRFLFMIMLGTSSRCDFNCQTLQTSPCLHSKDRWCASPFMQLDVLRKSVHHGMANDSDEAVEDVVSAPNEHRDKRKLIWMDT